MSIKSILVLSIVALLIGCGNGKVFKVEKLSKDKSPEGISYALPKGYINLTIERKKNDKGKWMFSVTPAEQPILVPDPNHIYMLQHDSRGTRSENLLIQTGPDGLLEKIQVASTDPLPVAVNELTSFIIGVSKGDFTPLQPQEQKESGEKSKCELEAAFKIEAIFDPKKDTPSLTALKSYLEKHYCVSLKVTVVGGLPGAKNPDCKNLICYRFLVPWKVTIEDPSTKNKVDFVMLLPNEAPIAGIDVKRLALVKNETTLVFNKGLLTSAQYDNPSVVTNIVKIPVSVLTAIVSIPSALFQFTLKSKTDSAELTAQKSLLDLQKNLVEARLSLLREEKELETEQEAD